MALVSLPRQIIAIKWNCETAIRKLRWQNRLGLDQDSVSSTQPLKIWNVITHKCKLQ